MHSQFECYREIPLYIKLSSRGNIMNPTLTLWWQVFNVNSMIHMCLGDPGSGGGNVIPDGLVKLDTLNLHQVVVESSEGLPRRADCHIGEGYLRDGENLHRGGDGALLPASKWLEDQRGRAGEAGQHHRQPEELQELPRGWDVGQAVDGGGVEEQVDLSQHFVQTTLTHWRFWMLVSEFIHMILLKTFEESPVLYQHPSLKWNKNCQYSYTAWVILNRNTFPFYTIIIIIVLPH